jgi:cytochrome c oxidase cbb3-type subunit 3
MQENTGIQEGHNKIPVGMALFFIALIVWLVWYVFTYTPEISGWSQYKVFEREVKAEQKVAKAITENPYEHDEKAIAAGKMIYASNCAACHGENLKGGVGPDLTGHLKLGETDDKIFMTVAKGTPNGMPPFEQQLGRDRIWTVLAYIDSVREYGKKP